MRMHLQQLQECITDSNRKQKEYDAEMARYRKELEDAEKATPGTYTKEKIDELCVQHGLEVAEDLLKQEKAEEIQKSKDDPKYNANQYYYTEQAIVYRDRRLLSRVAIRVRSFWLANRPRQLFTLARLRVS